jgi:concentrative nucleoside transporter, CNT family
MFSNIADNSDENIKVFGYQFGILVTSVVIFFSAIVSILYHFGIIQKVVYSIAWIMQKTLKTSGVESLGAAANIFIGQTEAPLMLRHYLGNVSRSELHSIMVCGFATIAGSVMAVYIAMGIEPSILITASLISAPGALVLSKIVIPPDGKAVKLKELKDINIPKSQNVLMAITDGATDGLKLALGILAMMIAFISIIALLDAGLGYASLKLAANGIYYFPDSIKEILGYVFYPFAFLTGVPPEEAKVFSELVGTKVGINEFVAYSDLSILVQNGEISERTAKLASFALCGFANFGSIAVQLGGIGALVPERKAEIAQLGLKAMFVGALTNLVTAMIAGILI